MDEKKSFREKLQAAQEICLQVQEGLDVVAAIGERVKNTFTWTVPWLSTLAVIALAIVTIILYYIPIRYLILAWGINKFTKKLRSPNAIPNNELLDFLSRVPSDSEQATSKPIISLMGSKFSRIRPGTYELPALEHLEKSLKTYKGRDVVTILVLSILNGSSSFLHTIRTTIKAWMNYQDWHNILCWSLFQVQSYLPFSIINYGISKHYAGSQMQYRELRPDINTIASRKKTKSS